MKSRFDQQHLSELGFCGFQRVRNLPPGCPHIPSKPGIYAVTLEPAVMTFLDRSVGGHFKGSDPSVTPSVLAARQIDRVPLMYVGRASSLRSRINLLARYARGEPVAHRGGRYLWQIAEHDQLRVAWRFQEDPVNAESALLDDFKATFGRLPFANLVHGTRRIFVAA